MWNNGFPAVIILSRKILCGKEVTFTIMRKKIIAIALSAAFAASMCACSGDEKQEKTKYTIDATLSADYTLTATVNCDYVNNNDVPLSELWFHLYPNAYREGATYEPIDKSHITAAYPSGRSYSKLDVKSVEVGGASREVTIAGVDQNVLTVPLGSALEPGERTTVTVEYTVGLPKVRHRFGYTDKSVNLANFYPIACVYKDGAFVADPYYSTGDPFYSEIADYDVTLTVPEAYTGAFTGTVDKKTEAEGTVTYEVSAQNVRDFAAVLGKYEKMSGAAGKTIVNYYYYSDGNPESALATAIDAVKTFGEMFGDYPYPEYSVVQTSFVHGGMEYPCLSMISDGYTGDAYNDVIVHETAHQWWYGVVGNNEVKNAWLDEALAEYSTMMFYEGKDDSYKYTFNGKRADALSAYVLFCETYKNNGLGDTSMNRPVNEYDGDIEYSYLTYVQGAIMLDDIRNTVGDASFKSGMKRYYEQNKYKIAEPQDLVGALEKASGRRLDGLFDSWLSGKIKLFSNN